MYGLRFFVLAILTPVVITACDSLELDAPLKHGWVIGQVDGEKSQSSVSILHTKNWGDHWVEQADISKWEGYNPTDVSAVDGLTAWVALGSVSLDRGIILHTTNGGENWREQSLPEGVDAIKGIKGLSHEEAWAASLTGTILHTIDSGKTWNIVEHPSAPISLVNRIDAIDCEDTATSTTECNTNIWIANREGGNLGMIHSLDNGENWQQEYVPFVTNSSGIHMLSAYSLEVIWAAAALDGTLFRTLNGGEKWESAVEVFAPNDFDDMCSPSPNTLWAVQNQNSSGSIYHVRILDDGSPEIGRFDPFNGYLYEGLTCVNDETALVVGFTLESTLPRGIILSTTDGGKSWTRHSAPVDNVWPWKTSFVHARR